MTAATALAIAIRTARQVPTMLLQMTAIGDGSEALDDILGNKTGHYEAAVDNALDSLNSLIEPIIMSVLGLLIGGVMVACVHLLSCGLDYLTASITG